MFNVDPALFYSAQSSLSSAFEILNSAKSIASSLTSFPPEYEYSGEVNEIISDINSCISEISGISRKISETKDRLCQLDNNFAVAYYSCAMNKYSEMDGLSLKDQQYLEMNQEKYEKYLLSYLEGLKSQGILPNEYKELYQSLKDNSDLQAAMNELEVLEKNAVKKPNVPGGRMTEKEIQAYKKACEDYNKYSSKKKELEQQIKSLQKATGVYQNKWYEDLGEMAKKTGSSWAQGFKSLASGQGTGDLKTAVKQTFATSKVIQESAASGIAKIGEWVVDGLTAAGGTVAAGATWLFHDTWSSNDKAGAVMDAWLDEVRKDRVGDFRKDYYENSAYGKWVNENSNLKYDSAGAKAIAKSTRIAAEIAIATAAEVCTVGVATPLVTAMFAAEGAGEAVESYTQSVDRENGADYNYGRVVASEVLGGVGGAMKGKMYGKIGGNVTKMVGNPSNIKMVVDTVKETGLKNILKNEVKSTSFWVDTAMTGGQKTAEVVNEYNSTGNISWGEVVTSFVGELLLARLTDKLVSNNIEEVINPKSLKSTIADMKNISTNIKQKMYSSVPNSDIMRINQITKNVDDISEIELKELISSINTKDPLVVEELNTLLDKVPFNVDQIKFDLNSKTSNLTKNLESILSEKGYTVEEYAKKLGNMNDSIPLEYIEEIKQYSNFIQKIARDNESSVSQIMKSLETDGAYLEGFQYRFKSQESLERKIFTNAQYNLNSNGIMDAANTINDSLRYTLILNESSYMEDVYEKIAYLKTQGYDLVSVNNAWNTFANGSGGTYQGLNVTLKSPNNLKFELQFHTKDSFGVKEKLNHAFYEIARNPNASYDEVILANKIMRENQLLNVKVPKGADSISAQGLKESLENYSDYMKVVSNAPVYSKVPSAKDNYFDIQVSDVKNMSVKYGDAGQAINYYLKEGKNVSEIMSQLTGEEATKFTNFLNNTIEGNYLKKLTNEELKGLMTYTGGSYSLINNALRSDNYQQWEHTIQAIDNGIAKYGGLEADTRLFRGIDIYSFTGQNDEYAQLFAGINFNDTKKICALINELSGREFHDLGYMSTSPSYSCSFATNYSNPIVLDIAAKKGTNGAYINQLSNFYNHENEVLLARGTKLKIISAEEKIICGQNKVIVKCITE